MVILHFEEETSLLMPTVDIISKGFFQLKYGFSLAAAHGDMDFGVLTQTLKKDVSFAPRTLEENENLVDTPNNPN